MIPSKAVMDAFTFASTFYILLIVGLSVVSKFEGRSPSIPSTPLSFLTLGLTSSLFITATGLSRGWSSFKLAGRVPSSSALGVGLFLTYLAVVMLPVMGIASIYGGSLRIEWLRGLTSLPGLAGSLISGSFIYGHIVPELLKHLRGVRGILTTSFTALPLSLILWGTVWYIDHPMALIFAFGTLLPVVILLVHLITRLRTGLASTITFALINWRFYWLGLTIPTGKYDPYLDAAVSSVSSYLFLILIVLLLKLRDQGSKTRHV